MISNLYRDTVDNRVEKNKMDYPYIKILPESPWHELHDVLGIDKIPIQPIVPVHFSGATLFMMDLKLLSENQIETLTGFISSNSQINIETVKQFLWSGGYGVPLVECYLERITPDQVQAIRNLYRKNANSCFGESVIVDAVSESYYVALCIIAFFLGETWRQRNIHQSLFVEENRLIYLRTDLSDEISRYLHQYRFSIFADSLFTLQNCKGFNSKIRELKSVCPENTSVYLEDKIIELIVASTIIKSGHVVEFVERSGRQRNDYDLDVLFNGKMHLYVEVKCKREDTPIKLNNLRRTLSDASKQLPLQGPCAVIAKIPAGWMQNDGVKGELQKITNNFFKNNGHVNAVYLVWEQWQIGHASQRLVYIENALFLNPHPATLLDDLNRLFPKIHPSQHAKGCDLHFSFGAFHD